jgi:hypothetical protein
MKITFYLLDEDEAAEAEDDEEGSGDDPAGNAGWFTSRPR